MFKLIFFMLFQEKTMNWYLSIIVPLVHKLLFSSPIMLEKLNCEEIQINCLKYKYLYSHKYIN